MARAPKKSKAAEQTGMHSDGGSTITTMASCATAQTFFAGHAVHNAIPASWEERAKKAMEYFQQEPIVSNALNTWRTFALGDEIEVVCEDQKMQTEAVEAFWRLDLNRFVKDMILQLLVKGECIGYMVEQTSDIEKVICVNPVSVTYEFEYGRVLTAIQRPQMEDGGRGEDISLDVTKMVRKKWNAPEFELRGTSMVLPAFEAIELLKDYRRAERAIAKRWATPLRFIQVGGAYGNRIIQPDQKTIEKVRDELERADLKSGLVVPFYVKAETYGAEGVTLNTESKVQSCKEDILVALGMSKSLVSGDGPNFATAAISMQKMVVQLKEIKQVARDLLDWVFDAWMAKRGMGSDTSLHYSFSDVDMTSEVEAKKLLMEMYDRGLISKDTLQKKMGLSPDIESRQRDGEETVVDSNWSVDDITKLVGLEVLTVDEAREKLGLSGPGAVARKAAARADLKKVYERVGKPNAA